MRGLIEDEPEYCQRCDGTGEGMYDGSSCNACGGSGIEKSKEEEPEPEDRYLLRYSRFDDSFLGCGL